MSRGDAYFSRVMQLADDLTARIAPRMKWMWGEALLGFALSELDGFLGQDRYLDFLKGYCEYWKSHPPRIDQADTSAPALITWAVYRRTGDDGCRRLTERVLDYIRNEPRILDDAVNHLGNSPEGRLYPKSIWVDSIMMFGVFPAIYASDVGDVPLLDFAARQPGLYSGCMQDPATGLWYHSYWVRAGTHYPRRRIFWGRGNGWVACALPMLLDRLPDGHPEKDTILQIFKRTAAALLPFQREDGFFDTLLESGKTAPAAESRMRPGANYREASATALIASGFMHGARRGWLGAEFAAAGRKAFRAVVDTLEESPVGLSMPGISAPTIPLPLFPRAGYRLIPRGRDWSYGVAALIFAAINHEKLAASEAYAPECPPR